MLYGGIAGAISRTCVAPLERLKTINQVMPNTINNSIYTNIRKMYIKEGFRGLYAGNFINCIRIVPKTGIQYMSYR